jgi:hypothetical protein
VITTLSEAIQVACRAILDTEKAAAMIADANEHQRTANAIRESADAPILRATRNLVDLEKVLAGQPLGVVWASAASRSAIYWNGSRASIVPSISLTDAFEAYAANAKGDSIDETV